MSPKKRPKNRQPHRTSTRRPPTTPPRIAPAAGTEPELPLPHEFSELDEAVSNPNPLALLSQASSLMAVLDPREEKHRAFAAGRSRTAPGISLAELCDSFMDVGFRQTDALLNVIAELTSDELVTERIRRSVSSRRHATPGWTRRLGQAEVTRVVEMLHVLRDGDNIVIGLRLPGNRDLTFLVYIDHNLGTVVKDAFVIEQPIEEVLERWAAIDEFGDTTMNDLDHADARARITDAIFKGSITVPPFETETWPACRPLLEWAVSKLPEGGTGYERPEWSEEDLAALTDRFFASGFGRDLDDEDHRSMLGSFLWFGTDYGPGDPLRWSPTAVEILLVDWLPRKVVAPADYLQIAPELLRGFVRFCHAERGIVRDLTAQTLVAIDTFEPDYQEAIRTPHAHGAEALLEALLGAADDYEDDYDYEDEDEDDYEDALITADDLLDDLAESVGGLRALDRLNAKPLPDEPFDWSGIPVDVHDKVAAVVDLADGCSAEFFDVEFRTACRRFLSRVATADPSIFRGRATARTAAAAVCWTIGQANDSFLGRGAGPRVKDVLAYFGVGGSITKRAEAMLQAIGRDLNYGFVELGDPALLVSSMRATLMQIRDRYLEDFPVRE